MQDEKTKQEKYDVNNLFERITNDKINMQAEVLIGKNFIIVKEKWYKKVLIKIREFLKKVY